MAASTSNAAVSVNNNSDSRDIKCTCAKLESELEKIRTELKSSQKIVELLQEDIKLISHNLTS
jgi:hypothetical protein